MRADLWDAVAAALRGDRTPVLVVSRAGYVAERLGAALGERPVTVAGEAARFAIARGIAREGGRPVVEFGRRFSAASEDMLLVGITVNPEVARRALERGWSVVRPALPDDVAPLINVDRPLVVHVGPAAAADEPMPSPAAWEARVWREGSGVTLAVSGAAIDVVLPIARMLAGRGVPPTVVEVPAFTSAAQAPLLSAESFFAGPAAVAETLCAGGWPDGMREIDVPGHSPRTMMESILAGIPAERPSTEGTPVGTPQ